MSYRSSGYLMIPKSEWAKAEGEFKDTLDNMEVLEEQEDGKVIFAFNNWKWYPNYSFVININEELERISEECGEDQFGLIVIGEDMAVVDEQGEFFNYSIEISW